MRSQRNLLIYPKFQIALILTNAATVLISLILIFFQNWKFNHHFVEMGQQVGLVPNHAYFKFIETQRNQLLLYTSIGFLFTFVVSSVLVLIISHRLAGPIVRLNTYFKEISNSGEVSGPIQFRKTDFFQDLMSSVNKALKKLK